MISIPALTSRMTAANADSVAISRTGTIRVIHFWGFVEFRSEEEFERWIETGFKVGAKMQFLEMVQQPRRI